MENLKPYRIGVHPIRGDDKQRFVYKISGIDYFGSIAEYEAIEKTFNNGVYYGGNDRLKIERCKGMEPEEVKEAEERIAQEKIDFQIDYVDFCNDFGYDANDKKSVQIYKYGRKIYGYDGVY